MASKLLSSTSSTLFKVAGLVSLFPFTLGLIGAIRPYSGFKIFGFPEPSTAEGRKTGANLLLFWASRDLYMGLTAMAAWHEGDRRSLGWMYLIGAGVAISDGIMSQGQVGAGAWKHVMWVPVVVGIGGGLLGWFD
ncbi:hypothetical protein Slin15195_G027490 [Septoria linicola]|uniref:Uncharacterized protein n=1 Tax=Septoria linicola TaxID=215465 RepID=A0A9Q9AI01_9PEZI|nr:hypothetical protein Slin15195_G027490 [Septoria linicola]